MSNETYEILEDFNKDAHPYFSISVCLCGILFNVCNVVVLTRPTMDTNPINALLTVIAVCDAAVMISYIPFAVWSSRDYDYCAIHWQTFGWACFVLFNSALTVICHAVSIWLTVATAFIRAVTVRQMAIANMWTAGNSYILSLLTFSTVIVLCIPGLLSFTLNSRPFNPARCMSNPPNSTSTNGLLLLNSTSIYEKLDNSTIFNNTILAYSQQRRLYHTVVSDLGNLYDHFLLKLAFWINGVLFKMVPCLLLTVFIGVLLRILTEVKKRKIRLRSSSATGETKEALTGTRPRPRSSSMATDQSYHRADRTTSMLIVLLAVFVLAELPQGLLSIITGLSSTEFRTKVYMNLGPLMDLLSLLNSAANFVIYCAMSQKFREVFIRSFLPPTCATLFHIRHPIYESGDPSLYATGNDPRTLQRRATSQWLKDRHTDNGDTLTPLTTFPYQENGLDNSTSIGNRKIVSESLSPLLQSPPVDTLC